MNFPHMRAPLTRSSVSRSMLTMRCDRLLSAFISVDFTWRRSSPSVTTSRSTCSDGVGTMVTPLGVTVPTSFFCNTILPLPPPSVPPPRPSSQSRSRNLDANHILV